MLASAALSPHATLLRTRPGQTLGLGSAGSETTFIVGDGVLTLQVTLPGAPRQIVAVLFQGDVVRSSFAPPQAKARLISATAGEVWRMRIEALEALAAAAPAVARSIDTAIDNQMARRAVHAAMLGQFSGEQRVATFLVELALRTGVPAPAGGLMFDMPLGRRDIAAYLGLNPDTLSRIVSRLRGLGAFSQHGRKQIVLRDFGALAELSPAAQALTELHASRIALPRCVACGNGCDS